MTLQNGPHKIVFVHIDAGGTYVGNGGFVVLTHLAKALSEMGHPTFVFDQSDRLTPQHFNWLSLGAMNFEIAPIDFVLRKHQFDYVIVSSWINSLLPRLWKRMDTVRIPTMGTIRIPMISNIRIPNKRVIPHLRYYCTSELLRGHGRQYQEARTFCLKYLDKIAIHNRSLEQYYRSLGFHNIIYLDYWVRRDIFN